MGMCCEKMMMIGWRNAWSMKLRVQDQGEDQRGPGKRLFERTVKHVSWMKRMPWSLQMEKGDKGSTLTRMGVSGWMFLLVAAYPGCPGQTAVKWLLLLLSLSRCWWYWQDVEGTRLRIGSTHEGIVTFDGTVRTHLFQWYDSQAVVCSWSLLFG